MRALNETSTIMPIACEPRVFCCHHCGWKKLVVPRGDVFFAPHSCPACGSSIESRKAAALEGAVASLLHVWRKMQKSTKR